MSGSNEFLLYVIVYRLSVLAIGALSIYLGFRLFNRPAALVRSWGNLKNYRKLKTSFLLLFLPLFVSVQGTQATSYFGRYRALVIGNQNYQYLDDLQTPLADAKKVAQVLQEQYGFEVELLLNEGKNQIMQAISVLCLNAKEEDNLLIYYAGHGDLDDESTLGYWQPIEAGAEAYKDYTWIPTIWITRKLKAVRARHVLIIADSCYSGGLSRSGLSVRRPKTTDWKEWFRLMHRKQSRTALTSGGEEPVLDGGGSGHSVFAWAFLEALQGNQGVMDGNSLFDHIKAAVANVSPQTPEYSYIPGAEGGRGDFLFVSKKLHGLSLEKIEKDKNQDIRRFRGGTVGEVDSPEPVEEEYRARLSKSRNTNAVTCAICYTIQPAIFLL
ncbi:MAG: caspase family protein [Planctomycetes bacterium]|nr:caspase family protein [Planctomycetota bacterium]